jgi:hypothetical protein
VPRAVITIACFYSNMEIASARGRSAGGLPRAAAYARAPCWNRGRAGVPRRQIDRGLAAASPVRPRNLQTTETGLPGWRRRRDIKLGVVEQRNLLGGRFHAPGSAPCRWAIHSMTSSAGRLLALENATDITCRLTMLLNEIRTVRYQAAVGHWRAIPIDRWQLVTSG